MNTKLTTLKTELREFIELSKTITPGKWTLGNENNSYAECVLGATDSTLSMSRESSYTSKMQMERSEMLADIHFVMRSRNISPAMAECLLVAVDAIILIRSASPTLDWHDEKCNLALQQILNIWEAAK